MLILTEEQQVALNAAFKTAAGNDANVDGVPVWASSDDTVIQVTPSADGMSATAVAQGPVGTAQVSVTADADLDDGEVRNITGLLDIDVRPAEAVAAIVVGGTPELKPPATEPPPAT